MSKTVILLLLLISETAFGKIFVCHAYTVRFDSSGFYITEVIEDSFERGDDTTGDLQLSYWNDNFSYRVHFESADIV